jgi:hypothetical protein
MPCGAPAGHQRVEHLAGGADRHVQFPAEFADIGDAQRAHRAAGDADLADMAEREGGVGDIGVGHRASTSRAFGPISDSVPNSSVTSVSARRGPADMVGDPAEVVGAEAGAGDDVEAVVGSRATVRSPRCRRAC